MEIGRVEEEQRCRHTGHSTCVSILFKSSKMKGLVVSILLKSSKMKGLVATPEQDGIRYTLRRVIALRVAAAASVAAIVFAAG